MAYLKIMLQPLLENAIYHGMEFMDGDGEIFIRVWQEGEKLLFIIRDNGLGMTKERAEGLLTGETHAASGKGSGIGVKNVNERIKLYFGEGYGLSIFSEPDEGTTVQISLPAVSCQELMGEEAKR